MKERVLFFVTCCILSLGWAVAQTSSVRGVVTSYEDGEPVMGASVLVKGTTIGTVTNMDGSFSISNVPSSAGTLVISFIGFQTQEVKIRPVVNVELRLDAQQLDEVMVVAYGTTRKSSFTGSASVMKSSDISIQKQSLVKSMEGKIAGVRVGASTGDPGADQRILIRGIGSVNGSTQPLYVIDGVPVVNDDMSSGLKSQSILASINPDDIESMTILKDAAAASLYGSRAANGVVIITTKQGKQGKTKVNYNMEIGWTEMAVSDQYNPMNAAQIQQYYSDAFKNFAEVYPSTAERYSQLYLGHAMTSTSAFGEEFSSMYFWNPGSDIDTNWKDEVYGKGMVTDHQISISGGNDKTRFYAGFGYNKTEGIVKGSDFDRYSGRLNLEHEVTKWLKVNLRQMVSFTSTEGFRDQNDQEQGFATSCPLSILFSMDPTATVTLEDGSYNPNAAFSANISNPNLMLGHSTGEDAETVSSDMMRSLTNAEATVTLPYGFSVRSVFGYDYMDNKEREFWAPESVNGAALGGLGVRYNYTNKTLTSSTTLNYSNTFGAHNVNGLLGYEVEDRKLLLQSMSAKSYSTNKLPELANGQPYNVYSATYEAAIMSYLGNVNYNYDNKYYASASFRRDGSSRLGADNRWANFWSISGAWRISGEEFLKDNKWANDLKLRLSYGTNGNLPGDYYVNLATYSFGGGYGDQSAIYWGNPGNSTLGWEKSRNFNVGIDWRFLDRVSVTLDYYNKITTDMLFEVPTSIVTGFSTNYQNLGKMKNEGVELTINSANIVTKDFTWTTDFNLTRQSIKIKELPDHNDVMYGDGNMYILRENESMHTFYLPVWAGVNSETGLGEFWIDPEDHSKGVTNYYSEAGNGIVGKAVPDWLGGITNTFTYKNFDLSFMISFQSGADLFDYTGYFLTYSDGVRVGSFNVSSEVAGNYWREPGDVVDNPKPIYSNPYRSDRFSSRTIRSTDNVRMRDITLGYKVPISKKYVSNLRLFFKATNPFLIYCATDNMDPDVDINGYRQTDTPPTRSFVFGVNFEL